MDINKLRYFSAVVESPTLRAAAELLNISPGALSRAMTALQREMDKQLFMTSGRNLKLTEAGKATYPRVKRLLEDYQILSGIEGDVIPRTRVATFEVFSTHFLADFLIKEKINEGVSCIELTPGRIEDAVRDRTVDVGITYIPVPNAEVRHLKLKQFSFGLFGLTKWKTTDLKNLPFAIPTTSVPMAPAQIRGLDTWPTQVPRKIVFEFEMLETALSLAVAGKSVLFCPRFIIHRYNQRLLSELRLVELQPRGVPTSVQSIYLVMRQNDHETPFTKKLARYARMTI